MGRTGRLYLSERSRKALQQARDEGMATTEDIAEQMGIEGEPDADDEENAEPHWSQIPPDTEESRGTKILRYTWKFGFGALYVIDVVGGWFADQLGLTSSKYQYVIDELANMQDEARREEEEEAEALAEARAQESMQMETMEEASHNVEENENGHSNGSKGDDEEEEDEVWVEPTNDDGADDADDIPQEAQMQQLQQTSEI